MITQSRAAGAPVKIASKSLADGLAAPITGEINLTHIDAYVDEIVQVREADIAPAWRSLIALSKLAAEPAAAVSLAALRSGVIETQPGDKVCMIMCGGNADFG